MFRSKSMRPSFFRAREAVAVLAVWVAATTVFARAPVRQLHDSKYTMLLAETVLRHGDLDLARYHLPPDDYRLRIAGLHRYDYFPVAPAVLSVPFVAVLNARGHSAVRPDGAYDERGELAMDARVASALAATFAAVVYATARLLLPVGWSLGMTVTAALGTQVFSTVSRSVWSDTWGILLVGAAVFLLLQHATRDAPSRPALLGLILSLAYIVRPTNAVALAATGACLAIHDRRRIAAFAAAAIPVFSLFVADSWHRWHTPLPPYFAANRLEFRTPWQAIAGNLVSPSRGLLVYVPAVLALAFALVRYRGALRAGALVRLALFVVAAHFAMLAGFWDWWGGHSYGPRLTTGLVPWLVLLAILAVDAARTSTRASGVRRADALFARSAGLLCAASIAMNAVGACSWEADRWNVVPDNINADTARLWDWRRPQFLAPIVPARSLTAH
jgi:hypothetical protein